VSDGLCCEGLRTVLGLKTFRRPTRIHTFLPQLDQFSVWTIYVLLTTDMGRLCRKALMSALFICKPPL